MRPAEALLQAEPADLLDQGREVLLVVMRVSFRTTSVGQVPCQGDAVVGMDEHETRVEPGAQEVLQIRRGQRDKG